MPRLLGGLSAVLLCSALLTLVPDPAGAVDPAPVTGHGLSSTPLDLAGFGGLAVDTAHHVLYVADPTAQRLVRLDERGAELARYDLGRAIADPSVSADGSTVWFRSGAAVAALDVATGQVVAEHDLTSGTCVGDVAAVASTVAVDDRCRHEVVTFDPASSDEHVIAPTPATGAGVDVVAHGDRLVVGGNSGDGGPRTTAWDVAADGTATLVATADQGTQGRVSSSSDGTVLVLDGRRVVGPDLATIPGGGFGVPDTLPLGAGLGDGFLAVDRSFDGISLLHLGDHLRAAASRLPGAGAGSVDTVSDGAAVLAVSQERRSGSYDLSTWSPRLKPLLSVRADKRLRTYRYDSIGELEIAAPLGAPGAALDVTYTPRGGQSRHFATAVLGADHTATVRFRADYAGRFDVRIPEDDDHLAQAEKVLIDVRQSMRLVPVHPVARHDGVAVFGHDQAVYDLVLTPTYPGNCAIITFQIGNVARGGSSTTCQRLPVSGPARLRIAVPARYQGKLGWLDVREHDAPRGGEDFVLDARFILRS